MRVVVGCTRRRIGGLFSNRTPIRGSGGGSVSVARFAQDSPRVSERDDLSIAVLELLAMAMGALIFFLESEMTPRGERGCPYEGENNSSSVTYFVGEQVQKAEGGSRRCVHAYTWGCLEMRSGW